MTFYAVIDTNVLVSSMLKGNSVPAQVISHVVSGKIIPLLHRDIFAEYVRVLPRKKFKFPISKIDEMSFKMFIVTPREMLDIINQSNESE
ncbi:MAG: putative toxin-antitoxin system toxin component, PIN family [Selenomonadaceae bacterium]|nr:putative toxin-antitoxin system toxin component, PIN family [Selenomonadaceae bacterium]